MTAIPFPLGSPLTLADRDWLQELVEEWHLLSDLSFSDLILWLPEADDNVFWAVAQVRPATGPTALEEDVVGEQIAYDPESLVTEAYLSEEISETSNNKLRAGIPVEQRAIPLRRDGRCLGVLEMHTNQMGMRALGALEESYVDIAAILVENLWQGRLPPVPVDADPAATPHVGDGVMRLNEVGVVTYASPNALTAYRHLGLAGDLEGESLADLTSNLLRATREPIDQADVGEHLTSARIFNVESPTATVRMRVVPLESGGRSVGALVLCRDTTELRSRERQLVTKDATIREIHHRVKNNLQTVAALLRMQARRIEEPGARAALEEAMGRVSAIALVHEILSQAYDDAVDFDEVCDRILPMVGAMASTRGEVAALRDGSFGEVPGDAATNLSLVLTELCQNAVEHGLAAMPGTVTVRPRRDADGGLMFSVIDDGAGLPEGFDIHHTNSLGLSIVGTLVDDLGGVFGLANNPGGSGTTATVRIPAITLLR